ncbi:hypothetical protein C8E03_11924 [Lachnotalea glycerini]|uniref:ImmA/IrrE family metallo-endopeptidase n=1 Tax=Lachnotalea glycerini TaxID=1763509 RepID=A0A318EM51_9FIRM|nr:hypothetical protein [Lachnotalea glycerini]PXV85100.1 hypothetical protein C8E03_11924 [Lachnotalea glycerini]
MKVDVLGTEYKIEIHKFDNDVTLKNNSWAAYCCSDKPLIVIGDLDDDQNFKFHDDKEKDTYFKSCLRHEIVHAFLNESGLKDSAQSPNGPWSKNEEMVDWIAIQFPKILQAFREIKCEE